ncbi:DUF1360 domain-containing protein [Streptomyces sp. NPDC047070]|uniref:DUF1360 domain-containing protein n=1 Tax=Streptomyces sp. NPDC047070 TaxID=3154923 RepID=UPI00345411DD
MIGLTELALLAAAGYRATQLVVHDTILDAPRGVLFNWHSRKPESTIRTAAITLISCVYCMGWWLSGLILAVWLLATGRWHEAPLAVHAVEWLAVAGAAVIVNRIDDTLGRVAP